MTNVVQCDAAAPAPEPIERARRILDAGGVVATPTDTIYGLAANALDPAAVERVFALKGREAGKPLPVVVRDLEQAAALALRLPPLFFELAAAFWPGPLTLVVEARVGLPPALTAGGSTVAMRQPASPVLAALLARTGYPLTATSANRSGRPACATAAEVARELGDAVGLILDAGASAAGTLPSTLVDVCGAAPRLLRPGAIPADRLRRYLGA